MKSTKQPTVNREPDNLGRYEERDMSKPGSNKEARIRPEMTVLDVVSRYRKTEDVFRKYDEQAGVCICCQALFESLRDVAERYCLDLERFVSDLEAAANISLRERHG